LQLTKLLLKKITTTTTTAADISGHGGVGYQDDEQGGVGSVKSGWVRRPV